MELDIDAFWNRVRLLIKQSSYTQRTLSEALGLNSHSIEVMSSRKNIPNTFLSYKIAKLLNTSVEYLITGQESSPSAAELSNLKQKIRELAASLN